MKYLKIKQKRAFTLAEVLITLAIIGVIAAISVPSLIQKTNSAELKVAYKKAFAVASQAYEKACFDGEFVNRTSWGDFNANVRNFNVFKNYFKVIKDCNAGNNANCWDNTGDKYWSSYPNASALSFIDSSGMAWSKDSGVAGTGDELLVDTNGFKGPNKIGKDRWVFSPVTSGNAPGDESGIPDTLTVRPDCTAYNATDCPGTPPYSNYCPSPPCYFTSWISGKDN